MRQIISVHFQQTVFIWLFFYSRSWSRNQHQSTKYLIQGNHHLIVNIISQLFSTHKDAVRLYVCLYIIDIDYYYYY